MSRHALSFRLRWFAGLLVVAMHGIAVAQVTPFGQSPTGYTLSFSDEFNSLNRNIWNDRMWYEPSNPLINYTVENGVLKIWPMRDAGGNFFNRTLDTDGRFSQIYGFFEIEARLPYGKGPWPAFWLFNHIGTRRPEIDVLEAYPGGGPDSGWSDANLHPTAYGVTVWRDATSLAGSGKAQTPDLSAAFHKYGVRWDNSRVTFYFDGKQIYSVNAKMRDPLYPVLSLWYGSASGTPDATTPEGKANAFEINYIRVWRIR